MSLQKCLDDAVKILGVTSIKMISEYVREKGIEQETWKKENEHGYLFFSSHAF